MNILGLSEKMMQILKYRCTFSNITSNNQDASNSLKIK